MVGEQQELDQGGDVENIVFFQPSPEALAESSVCGDHFEQAIPKARILLGMAPVRRHLAKLENLQQILRDQVGCKCGEVTIADSVTIA